MHLYKIPEEKYKGFYNPISHKKHMEYVPRFKVIVQGIVFNLKKRILIF